MPAAPVPCNRATALAQLTAFYASLGYDERKAARLAADAQRAIRRLVGAACEVEEQANPALRRAS